MTSCNGVDNSDRYKHVLALAKKCSKTYRYWPSHLKPNAIRRQACEFSWWGHLKDRFMEFNKRDLTINFTSAYCNPHASETRLYLDTGHEPIGTLVSTIVIPSTVDPNYLGSYGKFLLDTEKKIQAQINRKKGIK